MSGVCLNISLMCDHDFFCTARKSLREVGHPALDDVVVLADDVVVLADDVRVAGDAFNLSSIVRHVVLCADGDGFWNVTLKPIRCSTKTKRGRMPADVDGNIMWLIHKMSNAGWEFLDGENEMTPDAMIARYVEIVGESPLLKG